jgi:hypothetical protein
MDDRRLLLALAERLYQDIKFVTEQSPVQIVDDDGARAFNTLLGRVRSAFGNVDIVRDFTDWAPRNIKYKDALVAAGQLHAFLSVVVESGVPISLGTGRHAAAMQTTLPPPPLPAPLQADTAPPTRSAPGMRPVAPRAPAAGGATPISAYGLASNTPNPYGGNRTASATPDHPSSGQVPKLDPELYGDSPVPSTPRRNEDGTIPFTLD